MESHESHAVHNRQGQDRERAGHGSAHGGGSGDAGHGEHHVAHTGHEDMFRKRFWINLALTVPVLLFSPMLQEWLGFQVPAFPGSRWIGPAFALAIFFYGGVPFLKMAVPEVRNRKPGMMTLISLAITVAFVYSVFALFVSPGSGFFWEMATLIDVMLLGHWLEMRSVRQASGALDELSRLMPDMAELILSDGEIEKVPVSALRKGDLVLVRPGASIPADGVVEEGQSDVDEAMITGESKPVPKEPDARVIGGTINASAGSDTGGIGSLRVRVTATGDETALAGIMRLVEQAQQSKSDTQILADRAAGWLFYVALGVAAITAVAWVIAVGFKLDVLERVVTVLVIACPHALGLAIPLVVAISTSMGANGGILVRDRLALEAAREIDTVIFDKTGTLTQGQFGVVDMATVEGWEGDRALALATAIEGDSEHLIARGIRRKAGNRGVTPPPVTDFEAIKGRGIRATYDGRAVYVGGPRLLEMLEIDLPDGLARFTGEAGRKGHSVVYLVVASSTGGSTGSPHRSPRLRTEGPRSGQAGQDGRAVAAFALADVVRPESRQAVERLQEMGVEVVMLTGDSEQVASAVAEELGIDTYFAGVLPEHKDRKVAQLQAKGKQVAMVGDGVNDAPALTRADVGIAIGSGTDVAIESAGIILVKSNPLDVVKIFELSRATYRKMVQNLIWATGYNVIALPLAAGALASVGFVLSPALGALLMSLSTVIVAVNAQSLRRVELGG